MVEGRYVPWELLVKDMPKDKHHDLDFIVNQLDWGANVDPSFKDNHYLESVPVADTRKEGFMDRWIVYGKINGKQYFTANRSFFLYDELQKIVLKSEGVARVLREHLAQAPAVRCMFIYGSFARGEAAEKSDIDLFIVGDVEENDLLTAGIYHKLGYRGSPITQLSLGENDDCRGWLVGEPNKGLRYMFQLMNEARIDVGMSAAAIASAAYYASLQYAHERPQGRPITSKDPNQPQVPIIEHPDVKRMLLFQRSVSEGALALLTQCAKYADLAILLTGEEKEKNELLLDLLTPVAKSYPSEMGLLSISAGLQCLGGSGYCDDYPLEQYYRDARIHPIHEGTTGIHGLDLLGRKVIMKNAKAYKLYLEEVETTIREADQFGDLQPYARKLKESLEMLRTVTAHLTDLMSTEYYHYFTSLSRSF
jgi:predicted nucleotidyltransferase